jgi:dimethylamine monooxygenase subunit A
MHRVLRDLNPELRDYKGFTLYYDLMVEYLSKFDDGTPTSPGNGPE